MRNRFSIVLAALAAATLFATGACDDDETTETTSTSGTGGTTSTSTSGTGGGTGGGGGVDCTQVCTDLFNCGLEDDGSGSQHCADWESSDLQLYLDGCDSNGCVATCEGMQALAALVDPSDCGATVTTLTGASQDFADACAGSIGGCGGGSAGGSGGSGGAAGGAGGAGGAG